MIRSEDFRLSSPTQQRRGEGQFRYMPLPISYDRDKSTGEGKQRLRRYTMDILVA